MERPMTIADCGRCGRGNAALLCTVCDRCYHNDCVGDKVIRSGMVIVCNDCPSPGTSLSGERMIMALERERVRIAKEKIRIKIRLLELNMVERQERRLEMWDHGEDQHSSSQADKAGKSLSSQADEVVASIAEKKLIISSEDYGWDLASVLDLLRDHKAMERDLVVLEEKMESLNTEVDCLSATIGQINSKRAVISDHWNSIAEKAKERKQKLDESFYLHRFSADVHDHIMWMHNMINIISTDDLDTDIVGAEALLERHRYFRGEIDAREKNFHETMSDGEQLLDSINSPVLSTEVLNKLRTMKQAELLELWNIRQSRYEQLLKMNLFLTDADDAETWMAEGESFLINENIGDSFDLVDAQLKEHEDFEESLMDQAEYFSALDDLATKLIAFNHYAAKEISQRRFSLMDRRSQLLEKSVHRRKTLQDVVKLKHAHWNGCRVQEENTNTMKGTLQVELHEQVVFDSENEPSRDSNLHHKTKKERRPPMVPKLSREKEDKVQRILEQESMCDLNNFQCNFEAENWIGHKRRRLQLVDDSRSQQVLGDSSNKKDKGLTYYSMSESTNLLFLGLAEFVKKVTECKQHQLVMQEVSR